MSDSTPRDRPRKARPDAPPPTEADIEAAATLAYGRFKSQWRTWLTNRQEVERLQRVVAERELHRLPRFSDLLNALSEVGPDSERLTGFLRVGPEWVAALQRRDFSVLEVLPEPAVALAAGLGLQWSDFQRLARADRPADMTDEEAETALARLEETWTMRSTEAPGPAAQAPPDP